MKSRRRGAGRRLSYALAVMCAQSRGRLLPPTPLLSSLTRAHSLPCSLARRQGKLRLRPRRWDAEDWQTFWLSGVFGVQSAEKLVLAEGSKLALVAVETGYNQGVYGLVANLGSLVVRLLLQPFEEVAFTAFSR